MSKVSIVLPVYNGQTYISETITSVINQSFRFWELLICDDASDDNTRLICEEFISLDRRVKYFRSEVNLGAGNSRNLGLMNANYPFVAFLDADDVWHKDKLTLQYSFMLEKQCAIAFCGYHRIDEQGCRLSEDMIFSNTLLTGMQYLKNTGIGMSTSMINTSITGSLRFAEDRIRQDMLLWINLMIKRGFIAYGMKIDLVGYRVHRESISKNKIRAARKVLDIYLRELDFNLGLKLYFFLMYLINAIRKRLD